MNLCRKEHVIDRVKREVGRRPEPRTERRVVNIRSFVGAGERPCEKRRRFVNGPVDEVCEERERGGKEMPWRKLLAG